MTAAGTYTAGADLPGQWGKEGEHEVGLLLNRRGRLALSGPVAVTPLPVCRRLGRVAEGEGAGSLPRKGGGVRLRGQHSPCGQTRPSLPRCWRCRSSTTLYSPAAGRLPAADSCRGGYQPLVSGPGVLYHWPRPGLASTGSVGFLRISPLAFGGLARRRRRAPSAYR